MQPALTGSDGGGVGHPDVVGSGDPADGEGTTDQTGGRHGEARPHPGQPGDATPTAADAVRDEVGMDAGTAVGPRLRTWQSWMAMPNASEATRRGLSAARRRRRSFHA